jgi:radical SAM protein with 4Fe4S-binding SPASM domain
MKYGNDTACNAPFNNMYFTVNGSVSPCWKIAGLCDTWSNERSIMDIWKGKRFNKYRKALLENRWLHRCSECKKDIDDGVWPLAKAYQDYSVKEYPTLMELELSNQCNLECVMCSGLLSSGIRKNRDKLPPLPQIYDDSFVEQMKEFIPHLEELRFNGGEPFAQNIVLDICNVVADINPGLKINIATNGLVYNKRVQHILDNNNIHLNISVDSLQKQRYKEIRINGNLDKLLINIKMFSNYCRANNRNLSIMVNPMRNNWDEMVSFVEFTETMGASLWYNTILFPEEHALWNLESDKLKEIHTVLSDELSGISKTYKNFKVADHLVNNQIQNWLLDSYVQLGEI